MALMEFKIDGANTTDGGIDTHGDDLSDEIDGTYEKSRCSFHWWNGISETK